MVPGKSWCYCYLAPVLSRLPKSSCQKRKIIWTPVSDKTSPNCLLWEHTFSWLIPFCSQNGERQALPLLLCLEVSPKIPMNHFVCPVTPFIFEQTLCLLLMTKKWLLPSPVKEFLLQAARACGGWRSGGRLGTRAALARLGEQKVLVSNCSLFLQKSKSVLCIADETFMCHTVGVTAHRSLLLTSCMPLLLILWTARLG